MGTEVDSEGEKVSVWSFHSIGIPSEWGPSNAWHVVTASSTVSIQLGSPASGDWGQGKRSAHG